MREGANRSRVRRQRRNLGRRHDNKDVCYADGASSTVIGLTYTATVNYTRDKNMYTSATPAGVAVHRGLAAKSVTQEPAENR